MSFTVQPVCSKLEIAQNKDVMPTYSSINFLIIKSYTMKKLFILLFSISLYAQAQEIKPLQVGDKVPDIQFKILNPETDKVSIHTLYEYLGLDSTTQITSADLIQALEQGKVIKRELGSSKLVYVFVEPSTRYIQRKGYKTNYYGISNILIDIWDTPYNWEITNYKPKDKPWNK